VCRAAPSDAPCLGPAMCDGALCCGGLYRFGQAHATDRYLEHMSTEHTARWACLCIGIVCSDHNQRSLSEWRSVCTMSVRDLLNSLQCAAVSINRSAYRILVALYVLWRRSVIVVMISKVGCTVNSNPCVVTCRSGRFAANVFSKLI
jgi:hypothetical protein